MTNDAESVLSNQKGKQPQANFKKNPYLYMFYAPTKVDEEVHVPVCDDFIVFHIKKNMALKAYRLF